MKPFDKIKPGDVVLLYINTFPQAFLHIMEMKLDPNCVSGIGYYVTFAKLEIPTMSFTWQLNEDHLEKGWTMNGVLNSLQLISRPNVIIQKPTKKDEIVKQPTNTDNNELF